MIDLPINIFLEKIDYVRFKRKDDDIQLTLTKIQDYLNSLESFDYDVFMKFVNKLSYTKNPIHDKALAFLKEEIKKAKKYYIEANPVKPKPRFRICKSFSTERYLTQKHNISLDEVKDYAWLGNRLHVNLYARYIEDDYGYFDEFDDYDYLIKDDKYLDYLSESDRWCLDEAVISLKDIDLNIFPDYKKNKPSIDDIFTFPASETYDNLIKKYTNPETSLDLIKKYCKEEYEEDEAIRKMFK
ncbi:MAG: hypothetical protein RL308_3172 [Bacteroidota bacterium]|jgi:hypothetical protein